MTRAERRDNRRGGWRLAVLLSTGLHGALWSLAWRAGMWSRSSAADVRLNAPIEVSVEPSVAPPEPAPTPPPPELEKASPLARRPAQVARPTPAASATPPAGATTSDPGAGAAGPVDLTGQMLVLASSGQSAGGAEDSGGTGQRTGSRGRGNAPAPSAVGSGTGDRSGSVSLEDQSWSCPWPRGADVEQIDEQTVLIRVVVNSDGIVESATVLSDPGHGFGQAAIACALHTRFNPARDREGRPTRASSPPILVRFTR